MPLVQVKRIEGVFSQAQKQEIIKKLTGVLLVGHYAVHWKEFQGILTEEQKKRMQEELKLGGGPWQIEATFLAKIFDVIRYLNRR